MTRKPLPLRWLLPVLMLVGFLISVVGVNAYLNTKTTELVHAKVRQKLVSIADCLGYSLDAMRGEFDSDTGRRTMQRIIENTAVLPGVVSVYVVDPSGTVLLDAAGHLVGKSPPAALVPQVQSALDRGTETDVAASAQKPDQMVLVHPIEGGDYDSVRRRSVLGALVMTYDTAAEDRELAAYAATATLVQLGAVAILCLGLYVVLMWRIVRPLQNLQKVVGAVRDMRFSERAPVLRQDELGQTADAVNAMLDEIQKRDLQLEQYSAGLEKTIEARTSELSNKNEQLMQTGKMAAVGQLAAGVAHEINNPLAVILGFGQAMEKRLAAEDPLRLPVSSIVREAWRCKNLVGELLTFSRTAKRTTESIDMNELVRSTGVLLQPRARTQNVELLLDLGEACTLQGNNTQIQQVIVNLGTNAMDAMDSGGTLTLRTRQDGAAHVRVEVADTGVGIPDEIRSRIFEPFFTTKDVGKGTGLGLSLVYEIVQQHGGRIDATNPGESGTTMVVRLPTESRDARL
jgi:two-component system, NtrC family, sensor kinase